MERVMHAMVSRETASFLAKLNCPAMPHMDQIYHQDAKVTKTSIIHRRDTEAQSKDFRKGREVTNVVVACHRDVGRRGTLARHFTLSSSYRGGEGALWRTIFPKIEGKSAEHLRLGPAVHGDVVPAEVQLAGAKGTIRL